MDSIPSIVNSDSIFRLKITEIIGITSPKAHACLLLVDSYLINRQLKPEETGQGEKYRTQYKIRPLAGPPLSRWGNCLDLTLVLQSPLITRQLYSRRTTSSPWSKR